jgi:hypothetical protein
MKEKTIVIPTVLAATMLMAAFAFAVIPAEASQSSASTNDCGNGELSTNNRCQTLTSQIIGYDNDVTLDGDQGDD